MANLEFLYKYMYTYYSYSSDPIKLCDHQFNKQTQAWDKSWILWISVLQSYFEI